MVPSTTERVIRSTSGKTNRQIQAGIGESLRWHAANPAQIGSRLRELDEEWDIERTLEANASTLAFAGVVLGAAVDRRWLAVPTIVPSPSAA